MLTSKPLAQFSFEELDKLEHEIMVELRSRQAEALDEYVKQELEKTEFPDAN